MAEKINGGHPKLAFCWIDNQAVLLQMSKRRRRCDMCAALDVLATRISSRRSGIIEPPVIATWAPASIGLGNQGKGEAQGLSDLRMMPNLSMELNSSFAIANFCGSSRGLEHVQADHW
ncbi:hypothetical protein AAFF_G00102970 [Aldrovandia affinis]|uniref:Uncharacterized protein n=1 Tax=Aldrovandia affinis TaxID=143900 RepID=A0AAD7RUK0_9TELE|nr:hypothetical protein AAFF_G00102970 [Aldrovandia affinis]